MRQATSPRTGRSMPPAMPLTPATRPLSRSSMPAARPIRAPPAAADAGVNEAQSMLIARLLVPLGCCDVSSLRRLPGTRLLQRRVDQLLQSPREASYANASRPGT